MYTVFAGFEARQRTRDGKSRPRVNSSRRWRTMRGVTKALSSLRPTGCCSAANASRHYGRDGWKMGEGEGSPSITWEIALALFMCVRTLGHAALLSSPGLSMARQRGRK